MGNSILEAEGENRLVAETVIQSLFWDMMYFMSTHMLLANASHM